MTTTLPMNASLDQLKNQAKDLRNSHKRQNPEVCEILRLLHRFENSSDKEIFDSTIKLSECQFALAINYGFKSWAEMKKDIESIKLEVQKKEDSVEDLIKANKLKKASDEEAFHILITFLLSGINLGSSDSHLEPMENDVKVRHRIDGMLQEQPPIPKKAGQAVIHEAMSLGQLNLAKKELPQDGRIQLTVENREIDIRVSTVPGIHGTILAIRILDRSNINLSLEALGFESDQLTKYRKLMNSSHGLIFVNGPTGSGKTTTLYSSLKELNQPGRKIMTVEDPVEFTIEGIDQIPVRGDLKLGFDAILRSILRQAPNIIMVGEIRDEATANMIFPAAMSGHLVFTTIHSDTAPLVLMRLMNIGIKPFMVSDTLICVIDQRIVRCICNDCKAPYKPSKEQIDELGLGSSIPAFVKGTGCKKCHNTGYKGRIGVFSILENSDEVKDAIMTNDTRSIESAAKKSGWTTLRQSALKKALRGETTIEEVLKFT